MEEFEFSGFDDLPEALEQIIGHLRARAFDSGLAHDPVADDVMPSKEQLEIGPGDYVTVVHAESRRGGGEVDFMIAVVLNPEEHAETYPDWEDRLLGSYVLAQWFTPDSHEPNQYGWIPRAKLVKFPKEHWETMMGWIESDKGMGGPPPAWLIARYNEALVGMAEANPDRLPKPISCPNCKSLAVVVKISHYRSETYCMGTKVEDADKEWKELHSVSPYEKKQSVHADLICLDCDLNERLPDEIDMFG